MKPPEQLCLLKDPLKFRVEGLGLDLEPCVHTSVKQSKVPCMEHTRIYDASQQAETLGSELKGVRDCRLWPRLSDKFEKSRMRSGHFC